MELMRNSNRILSVKPSLQHMTVQVMWMVPAWGLTFQLPQQTLIIRSAS